MEEKMTKSSVEEIFRYGLHAFFVILSELLVCVFKVLEKLKIQGLSLVFKLVTRM